MVLTGEVIWQEKVQFYLIQTPCDTLPMDLILQKSNCVISMASTLILTVMLRLRNAE